MAICGSWCNTMPRICAKSGLVAPLRKAMIKTNGVWTNVKYAYRNVNGVWECVYTDESLDISKADLLTVTGASLYLNNPANASYIYVAPMSVTNSGYIVMPKANGTTYGFDVAPAGSFDFLHGAKKSNPSLSSVASTISLSGVTFAQISPDGKYFYTCVPSNAIQQYSLGTANDISTLGTTATSISTFNVSSALNFIFGNTGVQVYVPVGKNISKATLSTAYMLSTKGTVTSLAVNVANNITSICFSADGMKLYVFNGTTSATAQIAVFNLTTAFTVIAADVSATPIQTLLIGALGESLIGCGSDNKSIITTNTNAGTVSVSTTRVPYSTLVSRA